MKKFLDKIKNTKQGAIALILVIMITTITLVSALVITLISITDITSSYHVTESKSVASNIDACIDDALSRISSSTSVSGSYNLFTSNISCTYDISTIIAGFITVTSTASSTSDVGYWQDQVIVTVNVSTTPISIDSYKTSPLGFDSYNTCGDDQCTYGEDCSSCSADCGSCAVCGNGVTEGDEVCDDGVNEQCGDGIVQSGSYCNSTCDGYNTLSEGCDYNTLSPCGAPGSPSTDSVGCGKNPLCFLDCSSCTNVCAY